MVHAGIQISCERTYTVSTNYASIVIACRHMKISKRKHAYKTKRQTTSFCINVESTC